MNVERIEREREKKIFGFGGDDISACVEFKSGLWRMQLVF